MRLLLIGLQLLFCSLVFSSPSVLPGIDVFLQGGYAQNLKNKRVGLVTNHTGVNKDLIPTVDLLKNENLPFTLVAIFSPEHGIKGLSYAGENVEYKNHKKTLPIYSLHGSTRRPTESMLKDIDVLIFDMQETGVRAYTYASTLYYVMEEAAKRHIKVIVLDRPNPMGGLLVDGPMLEKEWRSFIGYVNVPYCHGMTIGELAQFFNGAYNIGCDLNVVPMRGWNRSMLFTDTGLHWIPPSPQIPEPDTPFYSASTGILGELGLVSIGIGYTLPFKLVGAPWIKAEEFAQNLNAQNLPGVKFIPFYFRPMFGAYEKEDCQGVKIVITDISTYKPLSVQYLLIGMIKTLYPQKVQDRLKFIDGSKKDLFCKANGNALFLDLIQKEKYIAWKMISYQEEERKAFLQIREQYLLYK